MSLRFIKSLVSGNKRKYFVINDNSLGRLCISLYALESLAEHGIMFIPGICAADTEVYVTGAGIYASVNIIACPGSDIYYLNQVIKDAVKEEIYNNAGVKVERDKIIVQKISVKETE
ncbi:MAG: hypothetical protein K9L17_00530 [Clostridiales bacterium]|nr:hypothetical protein [Clostridiales bacterium]MCF8021177.1 hypothetical protein [Clostridiales bacterium]